ncbi:MAG TPA: class I SAM-dependent methyltransferase [Burkholderiaceae bacterium]|jgi:arsenite methyltransferase|nr:class I SAM-dependent methyltransferase [Burkholderiaceae bacterium]
MPSPSLLFAIGRELLSPRTLPREPEPDLIMDGEDETAAYAAAGRDDKDFAAINLFHQANICQLVQGCREVVDLGCGPATLLVEIAQLNPNVQFHGVDLSDQMIAIARGRIQELGLKNIRISKGDITKLEFINDHSVDAVMSTVAFHHFPTFEHLRQCFKQVARILQPQGALYLVDFARFKSLKTVIYFAYLNEKGQPPASHLYYLDYERSLRAAFLHEEFVELCASELPKSAKVYTTSPMPFISLTRTEPKYPLPPDILATLKERRASLPKQSQKRLNELYRFFRAGGLDADPFR